MSTSPSLFFRLVSIIAGLLLFTAGMLKISSGALITEAQIAGPLVIGVAGAEVLLGLWLVVGFCPRQTRWLALAVVSGLLGVALLMSFRGEHSCNCFGELSVNPWWMVILDGLLVAGLLAVRVDATPLRRRCSLVAGCLVVLAGAAAGTYGGDAFLAGVAETRGAVVLTASSWEEQAQLIFEDADIGPQLRQGEWVILLHRRSCTRCPGTLKRFRQLASKINMPDDDLHFALVEIPEDATAARSQEIADGPLAIGRLRRNRAWIVRTPFFLYAREGRVYRADERLPSLHEQ